MSFNHIVAINAISPGHRDPASHVSQGLTPQHSLAGS
jgi:hypothetical protein